MSKEEIEWEDDSSDVLQWEIDYKKTKKKKVPSPKYTKLNSGERIIKTLTDKSSWITKSGGAANADSFGRWIQGISYPIYGDFFITNQRLIFESNDRKDKKYDDEISHSVVNIVEGSNGGIFDVSQIEIYTENSVSVYIIPNGDEWAEWLNKKFYSKKAKKQRAISMARERERHLDYHGAIATYEKYNMPEEAARVRRTMYDEKKVDQTVVHGDQITKTEIKDSVLNRSNVGGGKSSKAEELREAKSLFEEGLIDDDEFKQMKKEILGK